MLIVDAGLFTSVITAEDGPLICDHVPVPTVMTFPARVVEEFPHRTWSGPAFAVVGVSNVVIETSSVLGEQMPFVIDHLNTYVPVTIPVIVVFGRIGDDITAVFGPLICVHVPTPGDGVLAAIVAVDPQTDS